MEKSFKVGDSVQVRIHRFADNSGCVLEPMGFRSKIPLVPCIISGVSICGIPGCYSIRFADTGHQAGLPVWARDFE